VKITGYRTAVPTPEFHRPRFRPVNVPEKGVNQQDTNGRDHHNHRDGKSISGGTTGSTHFLKW
jgi:hypothetical protein